MKMQHGGLSISPASVLHRGSPALMLLCRAVHLAVQSWGRGHSPNAATCLEPPEIWAPAARWCSLWPGVNSKTAL